MSLYGAMGCVEIDLSQRLQGLLAESLAKLGPRSRVLAVPPDHSRVHFRAGDITRYAWEYYSDRLQAVLPALGTHSPIRPEQITRMFGAIPPELFRIHWERPVTESDSATRVKPHVESTQKFMAQLACHFFFFAERKGIVVGKLIESDWLAPEEALHVVCCPLRFPYTIEMLQIKHRLSGPFGCASGQNGLLVFGRRQVDITDLSSCDAGNLLRNLPIRESFSSG